MIYKCKLYEHLQKHMQDNNWSIQDLCMHTMLPLAHVEDILKQKVKVTRKTALRLAVLMKLDIALLDFLTEYTEEAENVKSKLSKKGGTKKKA